MENISKAGALGLLPTMGLAQDNPEPNKIVVGPYLQNLTPDSVTIVWISSKKSLSWVEYGEGRYTSKKALAYNNGLIEANNCIHKITLKNLKPGTAHRYRIVSTEILGFKGSRVEFGESIESPLLSFSTPELRGEEVKLVILNDIHDRPQIIPQLLYRHGYKGNEKDYDFVVFNGDCFDWVSSEQQMIDHLLQPCIDIFASETPFLLIQGNHECRGGFSRHIPEYFAYPENKYYFSFRQGPIHFLVLDSGEDKPDDNVEYGGLVAFDQYRETQAEWLKKEIEKEEFKQAPFRVLLIHISPYHSGDWHGTLHCREVFGPILNKAGIDLQISGHTHRYMMHEADENHNYPIVIGGGPLEGKRTLTKLKADSKKMYLEMIRDDGEKLGHLEIAAS